MNTSHNGGNVFRFPTNEFGIERQAQELAETLGDPIHNGAKDIADKLGVILQEEDGIRRSDLENEVWDDMFAFWEAIDADTVGPIAITATGYSQNIGKNLNYLAAFKGIVTDINMQEDVLNWDEYLNSDADIDPLMVGEKTFVLSIQATSIYIDGKWHDVPQTRTTEIPFSKIITINKAE